MGCYYFGSKKQVHVREDWRRGIVRKTCGLVRRSGLLGDLGRGQFERRKIYSKCSYSERAAFHSGDY